MCYLHNARPCVIHRDLKPDNLLLCSPHKLKIADFGLSKFLQEGPGLNEDTYKMTGGLGTIRYMAPEVIEIHMDASMAHPFIQKIT